MDDKTKQAIKRVCEAVRFYGVPNNWDCAAVGRGVNAMFDDSDEQKHFIPWDGKCDVAGKRARACLPDIELLEKLLEE